jgi:hypothetical protein
MSGGWRRASFAAAVAAITATGGPASAAPATSPADEGARAEEIPGGYRGILDTRGPEPRDGEDELGIGAILLPLGILRAGTGVTAWWIGGPGCDDVAPDVGVEPSGCPGLRNYGIAGASLGGLMIVTGIVYLAVGARRRAEHRRWSGLARRLDSFQLSSEGVSIRF